MSSTSRPLRLGELLQVLVQSRDKNEEAGITGILFYRDGNFLGCLEGEEEAVKNVHQAIQRDTRHSHVVTLFSEEIPRREFAEWTMAFRELEHPMPRGFDPILNRDWSEMDLSELPMKVRAFTRIFAEFSTRNFPRPKDAPGERTPGRPRWLDWGSLGSPQPAQA